ncbi:MAG: N-acetyl sugar amidotransferase [Deltaproteobacteria bacterium]|nr:N-acetyl sugar amidotransferase [Deltaproteobacteria bacterium]
MSNAVPQFCKRCVMDSGIPEITFDAQGVCIYCYIHDALEKAFPLGSEGKAHIQKLFEEIKRDGKGKDYDCIVGVSGGTDSTYLLHMMKEAGLRPLAAHFDNGWNTEISVSNIKGVTAALDVDLYTDVVNWGEFKDLLASFLRAGVPWADLPTDLGLTCSLYKTAARVGVKHIIVGNNFRTEGKVPTAWNYGDSRFLLNVHKKFGRRKISNVPILSMFDIFRYAFLKRTKLQRPMYYMEFNKQEAQKIIKELYGWEDYGGHHHESVFTRFVLSDWLPNRFGIDKRKVTYSALVRSGQMSRDDALAKLAQPPQSQERLAMDREYVLKKLDIPLQEYEELLKGPALSHYDFPSYLPFIRRASGLVEAVVRIILPWKPTMLVEYEIKRKMASAV